MWWLWLGFAFAETVDRVVAVVGDQPLLASDVRIMALLTAVDPDAVPWWSARLTAESGVFGGEAGLDLVIDAAVARIAAADVSLYQPPKEIIEARVKAIEAAMGEEDHAAFLAETGLDAERFAQVVRRRMVVERFFLRNLQAPPSDQSRWMAEADALMAQLRLRTRVRRVPLVTNPG